MCGLFSLVVDVVRSDAMDTDEVAEAKPADKGAEVSESARECRVMCCNGIGQSNSRC
jgi:hypothetical protein